MHQPSLEGRLETCSRALLLWQMEIGRIVFYEMREKKLKATCAIKCLKCGFYFDVMGRLLHIK